MNREETTGKYEHPFWKILEWLSQKASHAIIVGGFSLMIFQFVFGNGWEMVENVRDSFDTLETVSENQVDLSSAVENIRAITEDTRRELSDLRVDVRELQDNQRSLLGEDRVFRETPGLTYVREPVYVGDPVTFFLTAQRTDFGRECRFLSAVPVYRDERNIDFFGPPRQEGRQLTLDGTPVRPEFEQPEGLRPGRVTIRVIIDYECELPDGSIRRVQETTSTVPFLLLSEEERSQ